MSKGEAHMPRPVLACLLAALVATPVVALPAPPDATRTVPVRFARGASAATVKGTVRGYDTVDYVLGARQGQRLTVAMRTSNASSYFTVLPPGQEVEAPEGGSTVTDYSGVLTASGDWRVRVFLMRNAARRAERANYTLSFAIR